MNNSINQSEDNVITINAGGKNFQALKSTLCLPPKDSSFCKLFANTDKDLFFLDHDPELIETILNFLRMKKIEDPFDPIVEPPRVPSEHKAKDFRRLINHFGLTAYFYYPTSSTNETTAATTNIVTTTNGFHLVEPQQQQRIRKMSFDSHENSNSSSSTSSYHDSCSLRTTAEDLSITEEFSYCYG